MCAHGCAVATIPEGTPNRVDKITAAVNEASEGKRYAAVGIRDLLEKMRGTKLEETAAALDLDPDTVILVPHINECVLCDGSPPLHIASVVIAAVDNPGAVRETASPTIMTERGARTGSLFLKKCACCGAKYNMSYAEGGSKLERSTQRIWADLTSDEDGVATRWVQCSRQIVWQASLLQGFTAQTLHSHSGALSFCNDQRVRRQDRLRGQRRRTLMHTHLV